MRSPIELLNWRVAALKVAKPRTYESLASLNEQIYQEAWDSLENWILNLPDYRVLRDGRFFTEGGGRLKELGEAMVRQGRQRFLPEVRGGGQEAEECLRFFVECLEFACLGRKPQEIGKLLKTGYRNGLLLTDEMALDIRILLAQREENEGKSSEPLPCLGLVSSP
jgi:hypothetical protein